MLWLLDESALRRPDFRGDVPITLWDGQVWFFPKPMIAGFYPKAGDDGLLDFTAGYDLGPAYDLLTDQYLEEEDPRQQMKLLLNLAVMLLRRNYILKDNDLRLLLYRCTASDPRFDTMLETWGEITRVVFGQSPKPTPAGSASSSGPAGSPDPAS